MFVLYFVFLLFFFYEGDCGVLPMENNCRKWLIKRLSQQIGAAKRFSLLICNVGRKGLIQRNTFGVVSLLV